MNSKDREWLEERFNAMDTKLDKHTEAIACLQTKWNMMEKFITIGSSIVALITSIVIRILWR